MSDGTISYGQEDGSLASTNYESPVSAIEKIPSADTKFAVGFQDGDIRHLKLDIENFSLVVGDRMLDSKSANAGIVEILFGDFDGDGDMELGVLRQDNRFQVWQLMQNQPLLRYESKQADNLGNIVGIHPLKAKNRHDVLMLNYTGWIYSLITDR